MESKEVKNLPTSGGMNVAMLSEKNDANTQAAYEILFPPKEDADDPNIKNSFPNKDFEKPIFGNASTLDWLKTWRSLEKN